MDRMRADLISNFAKASGQSNNPFIQKIVSELRKDPAQRAANDPQLIAQEQMLKKLQAEQADVTRQLNEENAKKQGEILTTGLDPLIAAFKTAAGQITTSVDRLAASTGTTTKGMASGGMVYASKGRLINFQPKGTDTVPAMLTPGEFVVNRKATQKNLGLLRSINNGQSTSGNYAVGGVVNTGTPTLDQNTINRAVSNSINNFQNTLGNIDKNTSHTRKVVDKEISQTQLFNQGGVVYASKGQLIGAKPKGTDTVPAMLTPGEFVVNRKATQKNLPLLKSINSGSKGYSKGGVVYLFGGGLVEQLGEKNISSVKEYFNNLESNDLKFMGMSNNKFKLLNNAGNELTLPKDVPDISNISRSKFSPLQIISEYLTRAGDLSPAVYDPKKNGPSSDAVRKMWLDNRADSLNFLQMRNIAEKFILREIALSSNSKDITEKQKPDIIIGALADENRKYPNIFERNNPLAFTEQVPDPANIQKFIASLGTLDDNPVSVKSAWAAISDRYNYLSRIENNNTEGLNIVSPLLDKNINNIEKQNLIKGAVGIMELQKKSAAAEQSAMLNLKQAQIFKQLPAEPNRFEDKLFSVDGIPDSLEGILATAFNSGGMVYASNGKLVNFQSRGTDTIPAMLTPGEFVVNKKATQQNKGLLHSINSGNYSSGGPVYLAGGTPMSLDEQRRQRREAYEKEKAMKATAYQAKKGLLMTGPAPAPPAPAQQRQQPAQANGFEIKISKEAQDFLTTLTSKIDSFGKYIENLAAINIPDKIELNITAQPIEVRITGSAALENMSEGIRNMVTSEVNAKMSEIWSQSGGELGSRPA
jgi:hypothetical protein